MVVVAAGPGASHKVLLIAGKRTGASGAPQPGFSRPPAGFSRPLSAVLPPSASSSPASSDSDSPSVGGGGGPPMRKRQRLTHLSPEEKALRRSVSNSGYCQHCNESLTSLRSSDKSDTPLFAKGAPPVPRLTAKQPRHSEAHKPNLLHLTFYILATKNE